MASRSCGAKARLAGVIALLALFASEAYAANIHWQARRSSDWAHGVNAAGVSNWYTLPPPNGVAFDYPGEGDIATFARGARSYVVGVNNDRKVGKIVISANAPRYTLLVAANRSLVVGGGGLLNRSLVAPQFRVGDHAILTLKNAALLASSTKARPALIDLYPSGSLSFLNESRGGRASVRNTGGLINFHHDSSAGGMTITNIANFNSLIPHPRIVFNGRSTGGSAYIVNQHNGRVDFTKTLGPTGNGRVTAAKVDNFGHIYIGLRQIILSDYFRQELDGVNGELHVNIFQSRNGVIQTAKRAILGGRINITGTQVVRDRAYAIISAAQGVTGRFDDVHISGVSGRLIYGPNAVLLYVDP